MIRLSVVSLLENYEGTHAHCVESTQSHSGQYLLLMNAFPSTLGGFTCRRVYVHGSLITDDWAHKSSYLGSTMYTLILVVS
jgi:hypothetical protein